MLLTSSARADLSISGGTPAQQGQIRGVFAALPACCHTPCPICVRLLGDSAMNATLQAYAAAHAERMVNAGAVDGFYQDQTRTITLRIPSPTTDLSATFAHEYGHCVWLNVLSPAERSQYAQVYQEQRASGHLVSRYASVSVAEGFAEAFSFYLLQRPVIAQRDPLSCACLQRCLMSPQSR